MPDKSGKEEHHGLGDALRKLIFVEEDDDSSKEKPVVTVEDAAGVADAAGAAPLPKKTAQAAGVVNQKMYDAIMAKVANPEDDYAQFESLYISMAEAVEDEVSRFKAALVALKKMAITPAKIIQALAKRREALQTQSRLFDENLAAQVSAAVETERAVKAKEDEIVSLKAQVAKAEQEKQALIDSVNSKKARIDNVKADFAAVVQAVESELANAESKVQAQMKGGK